MSRTFHLGRSNWEKWQAMHWMNPAGTRTRLSTQGDKVNNMQRRRTVLLVTRAEKGHRQPSGELEVCLSQSCSPVVPKQYPKVEWQRKHSDSTKCSSHRRYNDTVLRAQVCRPLQLRGYRLTILSVLDGIKGLEAKLGSQYERKWDGWAWGRECMEYAMQVTVFSSLSLWRTEGEEMDLNAVEGT